MNGHSLCPASIQVLTSRYMLPRPTPNARLATLAVALLTGIAPVASAQLTYVDTSPVGAAFPQWDGGDTGLRFADVDADGNVDFLSIGDHGSPFVNTNQHGIMVYFGDGEGGWSIHMEGNFGYGGIAVGDVDGDGHLDVGYGMHHNYAGTDLGDQLIEVALGDGTGTSWTPWDDGLATTGESWGMFATDLADFDADGDLDLVSGSFGCCNGLRVYLNDGDGTWTPSWTHGGGNMRHQLATGDVDGDGYPDIAASYQGGTVWLGDGEGAFVGADTGLPAAGTLGLGGVALGDVDGDGCADLAACPGGGAGVYLWRTDHWEPASGSFPVSGDYEIAQLADLDADGRTDVAALGDGTLTVWLQDAAGAFASGGGLDAGPALDTAAFAAGGDVDHNGRPDLVFVQEEGSFPNYQNHLYVYREASVPLERLVLPRFPRGGETLLLGSVQTVRWAAAQVGDAAATIDLELSTTGAGGPWQLLAAGLPDGGHWQWTVGGAVTEAAALRVTLHQDGASVSATSALFRIRPGGTTAVLTEAPIGRPPLVTVAGNPVADRARLVIDGAPGGIVDILDVSGRRVRRLDAEHDRASWDLRNDAGYRVAAGVYLATLRGPGADHGGVARILVLR